MLRWTFIVFVAAMAITVIFTLPDRQAQISLGLTEISILLSIGIVMGTAAGLFGIGGGIIAIPLFMLILGAGDLEAKGVSLIAMVPAALSGSLSHLRHKTASLRNGAWVAVGALITTPLGALGAFSLPESLANVVFGTFGLTIALILTVRAIRIQKSGD